MPESSLVAAILLVAGPLVGAIPIANPSLMPIWSASREDHLATVRAHRVAWAALNVGFGIATIATASGATRLQTATDALIAACGS